MPKIGRVAFLYMCIAGICQISAQSIRERDSGPGNREYFRPMNCRDATCCFQDDIDLQTAESSFKLIQAQMVACKKHLAQKAPASVKIKPKRQDRSEAQIQIRVGNDVMSLEDALRNGILEIVSDEETNECELFTAIDSEPCDQPNWQGSYYWAPAKEFIDGEQVLKSLLQWAETGKIVQGQLILDSRQNASKERHLARCDVRIMSGIIGPPRNCTTVAIIDPSESWLRGRTHGSFDCPVAYYARSSGAIDIRFKILTAGDLKPFADSILKMITEDLRLVATETATTDDKGVIHTVRIESQTGVRNSNILGGGWRETMDFDVDLFKDQSSIAVNGTSHMIVERDAAVELADYHGANDAQRTIYASTLDSRLSSAIKAVCKKYAKQDSFTISCD